MNSSKYKYLHSFPSVASFYNHPSLHSFIHSLTITLSLIAKMHYLPSLIGLAAFSGYVSAAAIPEAALDKRATCTFTTAADVAKSKTGCSVINLNSIVVPAGVTLDLTGLTTGTQVIFNGVTTFSYEEWSGPLVSISGTSITVTAGSGAYLDGGGARWWDGIGSNTGGKTKPKFFYAHSLTSSTITGLTFKNSPVQVMSIDGANTLTIAGVTVNNAAGNTGVTSTMAHNTDAFDVGNSKHVFITGAIVSNQDDCLAVNSGTVSEILYS
jgi:polygalacturonase